MKTFNDLKVGAKFRWRSNFGAGDTMLKTGDKTLRNLRTQGPERQVSRATTYFIETDPVIELL